MNVGTNINNVATAAKVTDDAVGVSETKWFIAIVNNRSEKSSSEKLTKMNVENYVPIQEEIRIRANGKKVKVKKVMIPAKIFIHCTERERREIVSLPFIFRFMTNKAGILVNSVTRPLAVVPDSEMEQLKFMLDVPDANVSFTERFVKGDLVKVRRGPFKGLIGVVLKDTESQTSHLYINVDSLGCAYVEINPKDVMTCAVKH
ncbi:MAG: UpxY family transcription antiterminator [Clostridium sp.]|nr:UpxY family transcription antiterminator [Clostridium sp.]